MPEKKAIPQDTTDTSQPLPRVRFTGQQPGEEAVEKDTEPDGPDADKPKNKAKPSTEGKFSA